MEAGKGSSGSGVGRVPRWAHRVSSPLDPSTWPSVPWEGTEGILLGLQCLQVLSLGFGGPRERKGRTKGFSRRG